MSHFVVYTLCKKDTLDCTLEIEKLLAPYNEHFEVPEYEQDCYCKTVNLNVAVTEAVEKELGEFDKSFRQTFKKIVTEKGQHWTSEEQQKEWNKHTQPYFSRKEVLEKELKEKYEKPSKDCEDCHGSGISKTTYNPKSKWDWYTIGGRWDGCLAGGNEIEVERLLALKDKQWLETGVPFALVTPDGHWHERGEMGMFGMASNEKDKAEWADIVRELYTANKDCIAFAIDCHI